MFSPVRGSIFLILLLLMAASVSIISISAKHVLSQEKIITESKKQEISPQDKPAEIIPLGKEVLVNLDNMTIELRDGTSTISVMPIVSKGKPGSYYETPGGNYKNDYKEPSHFSSIGHVYMPWSTHIFGNFFIHGIPYYPDGTLVSSSYSGGCIRMADENAKEIYDFIEKGTPIIISQGDESFKEGNASLNKITSKDMTTYMVATISLEFLTQDDPIYFEGTETTRRKMLHDLIALHDDDVSLAYSSFYGKTMFLKMMNDKAKSIGLYNTSFAGVDTPVETTAEDYSSFMEYLKKYKSYLLTSEITQ